MTPPPEKRKADALRRRARAFVRANLPLVAPPLVPEIRLHLAAPTSGLARLAARDPSFGAPYWAYAWGGGLALARYLLDHPQTVAGRGALDLGAGCGLVAIAAAKAGARRVVAVDVDPYAAAALALNAEANGVRLGVRVGDPTAGPPPTAEVALVGDLFYEASLARRVAAYLARCRAAGLKVLVGDPWRAYLPLKRLRRLADYRLADVGDVRGGAASEAAVFAFE